MVRKTKIIFAVIIIIIGFFVCILLKHIIFSERNLNSKEVSIDDLPVQLDIDNGVKKGKITYELVDFYETDDLGENNIDPNKFVDSYVCIKDSDGNITCVNYPEYFSDFKSGKLLPGCHMYVCEIKATNTDAVSDYKDEYKDDYTFRADNIFLLISKDRRVLSSKNVAYYDLMSDGDHTWSTFRVRPGESISYRIGFILGKYADDNEKNIQVDLESGDTYTILLGSSMDEYGSLYKPEWEQR